MIFLFFFFNDTATTEIYTLSLHDALPIALVSRSLELDLETPLFTDAPPDARTIVITCAASPAGRRAAVARVADLIVAGDLVVDLGEGMAALRDRGLGRVLCE